MSFFPYIKTLLCIVFLLIFVSYNPLFAAEKIDQVQKKLKQALESEIRAQEDVSEWSKEKKSLLNQILNLRTQLEWTEYQNQKYDSYLEQEKQELKQLKRKQQEMKKLRIKLEPYLSKVVSKLAEVVEEDLPFLPNERQNRLHFLQKSLTDYKIELSERLRRILQALQVEAGYGNSVEVTERKLSLQGQTTQVQVLRLGRIRLFYVSYDGNQVGVWDKQNKSWVQIPNEYATTIQKTVEIAQQKRAAELVNLPIGKCEDKIQEISESELKNQQ